MKPSSASLKATIILLAIAMQLLAGNVLATSKQTANAATSEEQVKVHSNTQQDSDDLLSQIHQKIPNLEQALIIFTSFNGILIVSGAAVYGLRKRLDDQSASTLASIKATQSRIAMEKDEV